MEVICVGFLCGAVFATIVIGFCISRKYDSDDDSGYHGQMDTEDMILVLRMFRTSASPYEKRVLDAVIERLGE